MAVEPHRPPMINVGTETAFRYVYDHCKHFQVKEEIFVGKIFVLFCTKFFVRDLISYFRDYRAPLTLRDHAVAGSRWTEKKIWYGI